MTQDIENSIVHGTNNIFTDLGYADAETHLLKAGLVSRIQEVLNEQKMTQTAAANRLGLSQPDVSRLQGHFRDMSLERLLRLLTRLEPKVLDDDGRPAGLNLTRAVLDAVCKYPWEAHEAPLRPDGTRSPKFGVYTDDLPVFGWLREGAPARTKCLEAQVMDLSDDISYSVHDVEDAIASGLVQLGWLADTTQRDRVLELTRRWYLPQAAPESLDAALTRLEDSSLWVREMDGSRKDLARLKNMTSQLIGRFAMSAVGATRDIYGEDPLTRYDAQLVVPEGTTEEIGVLKGIATTYVITVRDAQPIYDNQQEVLSILVGALMDSDGRFLSPAFTADWHDLGDGPGTEAARLRLVVDQIASLTDLSAVSLHDRIRGTHWRVGDKPLW